MKAQSFGGAHVHAGAAGHAVAGAHQGLIAVYRGLQGDVFGLSTSELVEVTDVAVDDLQPGLANRLRADGIKTDSVEDAQDLVQGYRDEIAARQAHDAADPAGTSDPEPAAPAPAEGA